jgi:hypothetical protein
MTDKLVERLRQMASTQRQSAGALAEEGFKFTADEAADRIEYLESLTRAETPQSIPSEREEIVAWLRAEAGRYAEIGFLGSSQAMLEAMRSIKAGEHLSTRQALVEGQGSGATASRQPAGREPSLASRLGPSGDHQAQKGDQ